MAEFQIHFTRYGDGRRLTSAPLFLMATDIADALKLADIFISGMKQGGCTDEIYVLSIETRGVHGEKCDDLGVGIWETQSKRAERVYCGNESKPQGEE